MAVVNVIGAFVYATKVGHPSYATSLFTIKVLTYTDTGTMGAPYIRCIRIKPSDIPRCRHTCCMDTSVWADICISRKESTAMPESGFLDPG